MMIAQNPVMRATLVVVTFWYFVLLVFAGTAGVSWWSATYAYPQSIVIAAIGLLVGLLAMLFVHGGRHAASGRALREGDTRHGAHVNLGTFPSVPEAAQSHKQDALLTNQPWWPALQAHAPAYAEAASAVLRVMATIPTLPASPYPSGHGGRTLIEHSLAVATQMPITARDWCYTGQRNKRGRLVVVLRDEQPHTFLGADVPLLLLTGLAHDIGKLACYALNDDGTVREVKRNHDHEGARVLRTIPEVMALPPTDRSALLLAVGYYHHPFGLPMTGWITDRMRSLTELLAKADIAVGQAEGTTLVPTPESDGVIFEDEMDDRGETPGHAELAMPPPTDQPAAEAPPTPIPPPRPTAGAPLPREFGLFVGALQMDGALYGGGPRRNMANGWARKVGDVVYVFERAMRSAAKARYKGEDFLWAGEAFADNSNGTAFTRALLKQLDERGWLIREWEGKTYAATRAVFALQGKHGALILLHTDQVPGARELSDGDAYAIAGPLWGGHQGREAASAATPDPPSERNEEQEDSAGRVAEPPHAEPAGAFSDADLPMDAPAQEAPEAAVVDIARLVAAAILRTDGLQITGIQKTRRGEQYLLVPVDSDSGAVVDDLAAAVCGALDTHQTPEAVPVVAVNGVAHYVLPDLTPSPPDAAG